MTDTTSERSKSPCRAAVAMRSDTLTTCCLHAAHQSQLLPRRPADEQATLPHKAALADIGLQALQRILKAEDPLHMVSAMTATFPSVAARLSQDHVNATLKEAVAEQQQQMPVQGTHLLVNGINVSTAVQLPKSAKKCQSWRHHETQECSALSSC